MFHLRNSECDIKVIKQYLNPVSSSEMELLNSSKGRVVLISDDPGTGKSTVVSNIIREIEEKFPDIWVGRIDLNNYSLDKKDPLSLHHIDKKTKEEDVLNLFVQMIGIRTSLEAHLFKQFIKPKGLNRKYKMFFDGYDEISSLYKENVLKLFKILIKETSLQLWITTRKHEQVELEEEFKVCCHSLKQLTPELQVKFLDRLWKHNMKFLRTTETEQNSRIAIEDIEEKIKEILEKNEKKDDPIFTELLEMQKEQDNDENDTYIDSLCAFRSRIDKLDFTSFAWEILKKASVEDMWMTFMGIPLHLFMVGSVTYDKNLSADFKTDLHGLYSEFVEGKICVFLKEKNRIEHNTDFTMKIHKSTSEQVFKLHNEIAKRLMEEGKVNSITGMKPEDVEMCIRVGIIVQTGEHFHFIHRTFAEFFYAESVRQNMEKKALMSVIFELKYQAVRTFLSSALDKDENKVELRKEFFKNLDLSNFFVTLAKKPHLRDQESLQVFRKLLQAFEDICDQNVTDDFVARLARILNNKRHNGKMDFKTFRLLHICLTENMFSELFWKYINTSSNLIFDWVRLSDVEKIIEILKFLKESLDRRIIFQTRNERESPSNENRGLKTLGSDCEGIAKLFKIRDKSLRSILHHASLNPRENVFVEVLEFSEGILDRESLKHYLLERDGDGCSVLHCHAMSSSLVIPDIIKKMQKFVSVENLKLFLKVIDIKGKSFLHYSSAMSLYHSFEQLLRFLGEFFGGETVKEMLLQGDGVGKTVIHHMFESRPSEIVEGVLKEIKNYLDDVDMKELLMRSDGCLETLFHARARNAVGDPPHYLEAYLKKEEISELLMKRNLDGQTCLHVSATTISAHPTQVRSDFPYMSELLGADHFREFITATDGRGRTFLHLTSVNDDIFFDTTSYVNSLRENLPVDLFQQLIRIPDDRGWVIDC